MADDLYRIGTVSKLTGLSVECLRAWERRHGIAPAERSGRTRYYSHAQLARLTKMKQLIDAGHPISSLAELSDAQLDARAQPVARPVAPHRVPQVGLVGTALLLLEQEGGDSDRVEIAQRWVTIADLLDARERERAQLDVIVLSMPSVNFEDFERVRRALPDARLIVVYQFGSRTALDTLREGGIATYAWPIAWETLTHACATPTGAPLRAGRTAPRRYTDHELVALAAEARRQRRDAPPQLIGLITELNAFAEFAAQQSVGDSAEADSYERAQADVTYARAQLERALAAILEPGSARH